MSDEVKLFDNVRLTEFGNNYSDVVETKSEQVLPDVVVWVYVAVFVLFGIVLNMFVLRTICRNKCNGTLYFLMQLAICDIGSLVVAVPELFHMNNRKWTVQPQFCSIYLGLESFTSTATTYLIIAINFHTISTYNLAVKTLKREAKMLEDQQSDDSQRDNDNYEVANNIQQRSLTIDYRKRKNSISVMLPVLIIWFLAASVSIPLFVFGTVLPSEKNPKLCGIINFDRHNNFLMKILVLNIRILIPTICLLLTICIILKLYVSKSKIRPCGLEENVARILRISIVISMTFILFSMQRMYGSLLFEVISKPFMHFKYPEFNKVTAMAFCMVYYAMPCLRPVIYFTLDRNMRDKMRLCYKKKNLVAVAVT